MLHLLKLAHQDLRGSLRQLAIFMLCLFCGVFMIATVGLLSGAVQQGISNNARSLLGGDIDIERLYQPLPDKAIEWLAQRGTVSHSLHMRTMLTADGQFRLVEMKGVDAAYPLYGDLRLSALNGHSQEDVFALKDGVYGAALEPEALSAINATLGDIITIGNARYQIRATILHEPDRMVGRFSLGPRVMVSRDAFIASGLLMPGSMVTYAVDVRLHNPSTALTTIAELKQAFPEAEESWQIKDYRNAAEGIEQMLGRLNLFLSLAGLTALMTGGLGISHASLYYLQRKRRNIAILKCIGASNGEAFAIYGLQLLLITALTITLALGTALLAEWLLIGLLQPLLPVPAVFGVYGQSLALSALLGLAIMVLFSWPALYQAVSVRPSSLLRGGDLFFFTLPRDRYSITMYLVCLSSIYVLSLMQTQQVVLTSWFAAGSIACFLVLGLLGAVIKHCLRRIHNVPVQWRLAISNLSRPGAPTNGMITALGIGFSLMVGLVLVSQNMRQQLLDGLPVEAPAFFLIDVQPDQREPLADLLANTDGAGRLELNPMIRGRITHIDGTPVAKAVMDPSVEWTIRNERGVTMMATPGANLDIVEGEWWAKDYQGPPLISLDAKVARGYGISIGDTITINVLGTAVTGTVANLRNINWLSLQMNFVFIFSPGSFGDLPATWLGTLHAEEAQEPAILRSIGSQFPNISLIRLRDTLGEVNKLIGGVVSVVIATASITLLIGLLVVASAIATTSRQRIYDNVVLRVLGASRRSLSRIYAFEFLLLGIVSLGLSLAIGSAIGWGIITLMQFFHFRAMPLTLGLSILAGLGLLLVLGMAITRHTLHARPMDILRNE